MRSSRVVVTIIAAVVLAAASLAPVRERTLLVGRAGDARSLDGFSLPSSYLREPGRWTRGDGVMRLPGRGTPAVLSLRLAAPVERVPDRVSLEIGGVALHDITLLAGMNRVLVPADPGPSPSLVVRIRSATTRPDAGPPRGVFVERAAVRTGGLEALLRAPAATWLGLSLAWLAVIVVTMFLPASGATPRQRVLIRVSVLALAYAGAVGFRTEVLTHLPAVAALCWTAALALGVAANPWMARTSAVASPARAALAFGLCSAGLIWLLFPETLSRGFVLSQADMFYAYFPWRGHLPAGYAAIDRPPLNDVPMQVYPFAAFTQAHWWHGTFPLWTSSMACGQPLLATYQSALFSPFTWILAAVPLPHATVAIAVLRLLVGGVGMFVCLQAIGLSRWAAAFGGITYLFNPFSVVWLEHPLAGVPPWLPWMLLGGELVARRHACGTAALAGTTALVLSGGHPHTGMFVAILGGAYALGAAARSGDARRRLPRAAGALVLGTALVAVQVLPFLEYLSLSRGVAVRTSAPLNPYIASASTLITTLVPNFLGHHGWGNFAGPSNYFEQQIYPGIVTWLLAAVALVFGARRWRMWFFALAALVAMLTMYGAPGVHQLISALPLVKGASLPRAAIVAIASLGALAAFGAEEVLRAGRSRRSAWHLTAALALAGGVLAAIAVATLRTRSSFLESAGLLAFTTRWTMLALWLLSVAGVLGIGSAHRTLRRSATGCALVGLAALDLLLFGYGFHPTIPSEQVFPVVPEIEAVRQDRDLFRVMGLGDAMMPNAAMVYGLQDVRGSDGLGVARYADLLDVALRPVPFMHVADGLYSPLINLLNVKYVFGDGKTPVPGGWFTKVTDGEAPVYRNERVLPRTFLVDGYLVREGNAARRALRDGLVDFRRVVLLEHDPSPEERPSPAALDGDVGTVRVTHYGDQRVEIRTAAPARRLLVLTDVDYPGWQATIDKRPARLYRANFAFRAVSVPAGYHTVTFEYRSLSVRAGLAISIVALLVLAIVAATEWRRAARDRRVRP